MSGHVMHTALHLVLLLRDRPPGWPALLATYLRLKAAQAIDALARRAQRPGTARILGWNVTHLGRANLIKLVEDILIQRHYAVTLGDSTPLILDGGANIGLSVLALKRDHPAACIVAFEPDPEIHAVLQRNIGANRLDGVEAVNAALAAHDGVIGFFHDPEAPGSLVGSVLAERRHQVAREVPARRLSAFATAPVALLKLDIEGAEHAVLEDLTASGALPRIARMVIEYHHHVAPTDDRLGAFLARLEAAGFGYRLAASARPLAAEGRYQDLLVYAYRKAGGA